MNSDLKPKQRLLIEQVSKGIDLKQALILQGYSENVKSLESQVSRLNKNKAFLKELQRVQEKRLEDKIISNQLDKERLISEFYQLYQELRADNDASNSIKCLVNIKEMIGANADKTKQIEHKHKISFENLLVDMRKEKENKPMISIN